MYGTTFNIWLLCRAAPFIFTPFDWFEVSVVHIQLNAFRLISPRTLTPSLNSSSSSPPPLQLILASTPKSSGSETAISISSSVSKGPNTTSQSCSTTPEPMRHAAGEHGCLRWRTKRQTRSVSSRTAGIARGDTWNTRSWRESRKPLALMSFSSTSLVSVDTAKRTSPVGSRRFAISSPKELSRRWIISDPKHLPWLVPTQNQPIPTPLGTPTRAIIPDDLRPQHDRPLIPPYPLFRYQVVYSEKGVSLFEVASLKDMFKHLDQIVDGMRQGSVNRTACSRLNLALVRLHDAGWVHGDLSPGNIIVVGGGVAKISDLEFAKRRAVQDLERLTRPKDSSPSAVQDTQMVNLCLITRESN